ncbi:MAG: hypothetical protein Q8N05_12100 [Bacteroidota bacterium]|nr:hypothetical protein [Bacteroidota bacterium]
MTIAFFAVKFHLTNDPGVVDLNDRYFQELKDKYGHGSDEGSDIADFSEARLLYDLSVLSKYYPANAFFIQNAYYKSHNLKVAQNMLHAVDLHMQDNEAYHADINKFEVNNDPKQAKLNSESVFEWMNIKEWQDFKLAVAKDKSLIDSAANLTGVEPRLIVSLLVGEQIRLFNSSREAYKKWIGPLKILSVETTFSLGVTGIKVPTAQTIETNLKDSTSVFYLGKKYGNLLDFQTKNTTQERFNRLTSYKNHFYSYLYAALNVKQVNVQWERSGFPISGRPEILSTLYNIGYEASIPKENPEVGGSGISIKGKLYSFGAIAYEFYYSGELFELFPFKNSSFDFTDK